MGTLYLVATPIGNLDDMTYRAVRTLNDVDLIAAEDTRHSGRLLKHFGIETPQISFHGHSPERRFELLLAHLETQDVALITDAGMPAVSDPGADLVRRAVDRGFGVEMIPGPSSVTAAVAISGLVDSGFLFAGYPPRRTSARHELFRRLRVSGYPVVLFEAPGRVVTTLEDLAAVFGDVPVAVGRELTKLHEEVIRGSISQALDHFREHAPRGEFVLVIGQPKLEDEPVDQHDVESLARTLIEQGLSPSKAARELAELAGLNRREAYELLVRVRHEGRDR